MFQKLQSGLLSRRMRGPAQLALDVAGWSSAYALAWVLASGSPSGWSLVATAMVVIAVVVGLTSAVGGYSSRWRVAEYRQVRSIATIGLVGGTVGTAVLAGFGIEGSPTLGLATTAIGLASTVGVRGV